MANRAAVLSVRIVGDSRGLQGALRSASRAVSAEMGKIDAASKKIGGAVSGMLRLASSFTKVGVVSAALLTATAAVSTLGGSLLTLAGILPVLPGLLAGFALGAVVTGLALKDIGTVLADLGPAFTDLQKSVSAKFWKQAADPIRSLVKTTLPALREGMEETASAIGDFFASTADALKNSLTPDVVAGMFKPLVESINIAKAGMRPLVNAFTTLGTVGGQYLPRLSAAFVKLAEKFDAFIQTSTANGKLKEWIDDAIQGFKDFGSIVGSIGRILDGVFTAASQTGGTTLGTLSAGLEKVAGIVESPAFQKTLGNLFTGAKGAMDNLSKAFGPLGSAFAVLSPAMSDFMRIAGQIAGTVLATLAGMLEKNKPLIDGLVIGFQQFAEWISTAGDFVLQHSQAFTALAIFIGALAIAIKVATTAAAIFNAVMALNPIALIVIAVLALIAVIVYLATQTTFFQDVWAAMCKFASDVWNGFVGFITDVWNGFMGWIGGILGSIGSFFSDAFNNAQSIVSTVAGNIERNIQGMRDGIDTVISGIRDIFSNAFNGAKSIVEGAIGGITGAINGIAGAVQGAMSWIRNLFNMGGMPSWLSSVLGMGGTGFEFTGALAPSGGDFGIGATGGYSGASLFSGGSGSGINITQNVTIEFKGLVTDRVGTAREIKRLLDDEARLVGQR